jgi:hypothetical protein
MCDFADNAPVQIQAAFVHPPPIVHVGPLDGDKCPNSGCLINKKNNELIVP